MTHRIAVFLPNWIGDAVMAIPTIRALRSYYGPAAHIVGIMKPTIADVFDATPWLNEVWLYSPGEGKWIHRSPALLGRFLRDPFDVSVHLTNDFLSVLLSRLGGTSSCAGYRRRLRGCMLSTGLDAARAGRRFVPVSALDYYLQIAYALGCPTQSPATELGSNERDEAAADRAWQNFGLTPDDPVVIVNSSGAFGSAKSWPEDSCASLAVRIAERVDHAV